MFLHNTSPIFSVHDASSQHLTGLVGEIVEGIVDAVRLLDVVYITAPPTDGQDAGPGTAVRASVVTCYLDLTR